MTDFDFSCSPMGCKYFTKNHETGCWKSPEIRSGNAEGTSWGQVTPSLNRTPHLCVKYGLVSPPQQCQSVCAPHYPLQVLSSHESFSSAFCPIFRIPTRRRRSSESHDIMRLSVGNIADESLDPGHVGFRESNAFLSQSRRFSGEALVVLAEDQREEIGNSIPPSVQSSVPGVEDSEVEAGAPAVSSRPTLPSVRFDEHAMGPSPSRSSRSAVRRQSDSNILQQLSLSQIEALSGSHGVSPQAYSSYSSTDHPSFQSAFAPKACHTPPHSVSPLVSSRSLLSPTSATGLPPAPAPNPTSAFIARRLGARRVSEPYAHSSLSDEQRSFLLGSSSLSPQNQHSLANKSFTRGASQKMPRPVGLSASVIREYA
jgi:hypothetical protein